MRRLFFLIACLYSLELHSQSDCSHPTQVTVCPAVSLTNQTNAGMGDDAPPACNIPGNDVLYEISTPNGANQIYISIQNATASLVLSLEQTACGSDDCNSRYVPSGNSNVTFNVSSSSLYYLWVDATIDVTYDISFGADTGFTLINIPNTQGNLQFDGSPCDTPLFNFAKPYFQVSFNDTFKINPMTLSPLFTTGSMCVTTFFKNTTGIQGVVKFEFDFNPLGYLSVIAPASVPGNYNVGNWISGHSGSIYSFTFIDSAGTGKGDFTGTPDSCLAYKFCFDIIPISNSPLLTNVTAQIYADGFGAGFTGLVNSGCCPALNVNCLFNSGSGGGGGTASSFGYGFDDPAAFPIGLTSFTARVVKNKIKLNWATASEINNNFFTVEKCQQIGDWISVSKLNGAGNSTSTLFYESTDYKPFYGTSYYRLKQTDFDGTISYSGIRSVHVSKTDDINIYPNPASASLIVEANEASSFQLTLFNFLGMKVNIPINFEAGLDRLNTSELPSGIYFLMVEEDNIILKIEKIVIGEHQ